MTRVLSNGRPILGSGKDSDWAGAPGIGLHRSAGVYDWPEVDQRIAGVADGTPHGAQLAMWDGVNSSRREERMKRIYHRKGTENDGDETHQTLRPSTEGGRLGPQPSASAVTEPEPVRDASGTGGASGGLNSSVGGVAGSALDRAPNAPPKRKAASARAARKG
jgi:hypothetical protein